MKDDTFLILLGTMLVGGLYLYTQSPYRPSASAVPMSSRSPYRPGSAGDRMYQASCRGETNYRFNPRDEALLGKAVQAHTRRRMTNYQAIPERMKVFPRRMPDGSVRDVGYDPISGKLSYVNWTPI